MSTTAILRQLGISPEPEHTIVSFAVAA